MASWSWSRLSLHAQCPRRYWHRYLDRTKALIMATSADLFFGLRIHEALRHIYERQRDGIVPTEDEVVARFRERWDALRPTGERALEFRANELQEPETVALGERLIREFVRATLPFDQDRTVDREVNLSVVLDADGTRFGGRADRIAVRPDGTWVITDYKNTGRLHWSP